jgi:hypothetical protein
VIVTGANGINRTGGGSGVCREIWWLHHTMTSESLCLNNSTCFLTPKYDISGGGGSEIVYNSNNVANGLGALSNFVKGVAEK